MWGRNSSDVEADGLHELCGPEVLDGSEQQ